MKKNRNTFNNQLFSYLFLLTGIFAIAGGFYTWGDGVIFDQNELIQVLIPWADIVLTGPVSIISAYGLRKNLTWGQKLGLTTSGIYVFGSLLVFISMIWNDTYPFLLILPSISGFLIGISFTFFQLRKT